MTKDSSVRSGEVTAAMDEMIRLRSTRAPSLNQLREWRDHVEALETALGHFVNVRDQFPQSVKLIQKSMDGFTPVTVTVTKAQFLEALAALHKGNTNVQG